jgi:hypothetical protein
MDHSSIQDCLGEGLASEIEDHRCSVVYGTHVTNTLHNLNADEGGFVLLERSAMPRARLSDQTWL